MDVPLDPLSNFEGIYQVLLHIQNAYQKRSDRLARLSLKIDIYRRILTKNFGKLAGEISVKESDGLLTKRVAFSRIGIKELSKMRVMVNSTLSILQEIRDGIRAAQDHELIFGDKVESRCFTSELKGVRLSLQQAIYIDAYGDFGFIGDFLRVFAYEPIVYVSVEFHANPEAKDLFKVALDLICGGSTKHLEGKEELVKPIFMSLYKQLMSQEYLYHPLRGLICRIAPEKMQHGSLLDIVEKILGIPENDHYHSILQSYASNNNFSMTSDNGEWLKPSELIELVSLTPDAHKIWYNIAQTCITSGRLTAIDWLTERALVFACRKEHPSFLRDVIINATNVETITDLIDSFMVDDVPLDDRDEHNKKIIHYLIDRREELALSDSIRDLVEGFYTTDAYDNDMVSFSDYAKEKRKFRAIKVLKEVKEQRNEFALISKRFFGKKHGLPNVIILGVRYPSEITLKALGVTRHQNPIIVNILPSVSHNCRVCICNSEFKECSANNDEHNYFSGKCRIREILDQEGIKFITSKDTNSTLIEYTKLRQISSTIPKKKKNRAGDFAVLNSHPIELQTAVIAAAGSGGGVREKKKKTRAPFEVITPKFTEAERNAVYIRIHTERATRLYDACALHRTFDQPVVTKVTLSEYKLHVQRILVACYSEEVAIYCYAIQHYDPKTSTSSERALCAAPYAEFKVRNNKVVAKAYNPATEESLVELKPSKNIGEKPVMRCDSVHLKAAVHEFLFLKGVWAWYRELLKPESIHESILMDCTRLCATRFYNAMLLYHREGGATISINDGECCHLRNILVHNVEIYDLKEHVQTVLFPFGEKVLEFSKTSRVEGEAILLRECAMYAFEIQDASKLQGRLCRDPVLQLLTRIRLYIALIQSKIAYDGGSALLNCLNRHWDKIADELKIWIHHARAIESCILQIGQLARSNPRFMSKEVQAYVALCREVRHVGHHENTNDADWNFDPINPSFLADMMRGVPKV